MHCKLAVLAVISLLWVLNCIVRPNHSCCIVRQDYVIALYSALLQMLDIGSLALIQ